MHVRHTASVLERGVGLYICIGMEWSRFGSGDRVRRAAGCCRKTQSVVFADRRAIGANCIVRSMLITVNSEADICMHSRR